MRQIIYGTSNPGNITSVSKLTNGMMAFVYDNTVINTSNVKDAPKAFSLLVKRSADNGGDIVIPIHKNNFSYVKSETFAATTFEGEITVNAAGKGLYTIIIAKKGVGFNERNKWSFSYYNDADTLDTTKMSNAIIKEMTSSNCGVTAKFASGKFTITAIEKGVDYAIIGADLLTNAAVNITTPGSAGLGTSKQIAELFSKAAADNGILYTYEDGMHDLYPNYPGDPSTTKTTTDELYTVYTLRFAEPRAVKTRDEVVNQIVQIVVKDAQLNGYIGDVLNTLVSNGGSEASAVSVDDDEEL